MKNTTNRKRGYEFNQGMNTSGCQFKDHDDIIISFKDSFKRYVSLTEAKEFDEFTFGELEFLESLPLIGTAYYNLGVKKVEELQYDVSNINTELLRKTHGIVKNYLLEKFGERKIFTASQINGFLEGIYLGLGISKEPHFSDLMHYLEKTVK